MREGGLEFASVVFLLHGRSGIEGSKRASD